MKLTVNFFGEPRLFVEGQEVFIPPKKVLAVFLYLVYHKSCNRDDMVSKFWCNHSEAGAKQNLRNTIYTIKRYLGHNILVTKGNSYVQISPDIEVVRDIDVFTTENNAKPLLALQELVFMDNLHLSQCEEFEQWKSEIQRIYEAIFSDRLEAELQTSLRIGDLEYAEQFAEKLLALDCYNEAAVRTLMNIYLEQGSYSKGIKRFCQMERCLKKELGVSPELETQALYEKILKFRDAKKGTGDKRAFFFGRICESVALGQEYERFLRGEPYRHCVVSGGIGCGKTRLIHAFFEKRSVANLLDLEFEFAVKDTAYHAINRIVSGLFQLLNKKPSGITQSEDPDVYYTWAMGHALELLENRVVLILRNMEAIDRESMEIMAPYFLDGFGKNIFFVGEYCPNYLTDSRLLSVLQLLPGALTLPLTCLSERETAEFLGHIVADKDIPQATVRKIYAFTQGNLLFLQDIVPQLQKGNFEFFDVQEKTRNQIKLFVLSLSPDERSMMELLSLFENGISVHMAAELTGRSVVDTLETLDHLVRREVVEQASFIHHVLLRISNRIIQNTVYATMQDFKKIHLHDLTARLFEKDFPRDSKDYFCVSELKYHYTRSKNSYKALYFTLEHLEYILDYCDQFFPTLRPLAGEKIGFYINRDEVYKQFEDCKKSILELEDILGAAELCELKMKFSFLIGRTLNRDGKRERGIHYTKELIILSKKLDREDYLLKAYLEMSYYGLKSGNTALMEEYLNKTATIQNLSQYEIEQGVIYRLWGIVHIRKEQYAQAEEWLWKSIHLFESPHLYNQNFMNIAAAYDYMGLLRRKNGDYHNAQEYFLKAIDICESKNIKKSMDIFYMDLGYNYFLQEEYEQAENCFNKSSRLYDEFGTYWLRAITESGLAMLHLRKGDHKKAMEHYHRAEIFGRKDSVKEEMVMLEQAREQLRQSKLLKHIVAENETAESCGEPL